MFLQIDTLAYGSQLRQLPPEHKLLFAIALLLITSVAHGSVQLLITGWMSIWITIYAGIPAVIYLRLLAIPIGFWLVSLPALVISSIDVAHLFSVQTDVWQGVAWGNRYLYLSHQGLQQAGELGARAIASTACLYFVILTIPFSEIVTVLHRIGCPPLLTELMTIMYRFIFVLLQTANQLWTAQQARGGYWTRNLWLKSLGLLIGQLLCCTLENYRQVSLTLAARGFTGSFRVCHSRQYWPSKRYSLEALFGCTILVTLTGWMYVVGI